MFPPIQRDAAVGFTKVLPLPRHPVHPMAGPDASEGQAVWQPGGAEEDSRLREGNRHLHLAYDEEEEDTSDLKIGTSVATLPGA